MYDVAPPSVHINHISHVIQHAGIQGTKRLYQYYHQMANIFSDILVYWQRMQGPILVIC